MLSIEWNGNHSHVGFSKDDWIKLRSRTPTCSNCTTLSPHLEGENTHPLVHSTFYVEIWSIALECVVAVIAAATIDGWMQNTVHSLWAYISHSHGLFACLSFQYQRFNELDICNDKNTPTKPQNIDKHIETQRTVPHFRLNMRQ